MKPLVTILRIREATGLVDLAEWHRSKGGDLKFKVSRESSFALAVEGPALSLLRELQTVSRIDVECSFDVVTEDADKGLEARLGLFDGLFGLAIVSAARSVTVPSSSNVRTELLTCLWRRAQARRGEIGDGRRRSLVFRDPDEPVPECLRVGQVGFPKRDRFSAVLFEKARGLVAGGVDKRRYSLSEEDAITFVFEAARNSFEHARSDEHGSAIRGIRGVVLEKLKFASRQEAQSRRDLSQLHREYIERVWVDLYASKFALAYSVIDLGPGIHHTLPFATPDESPWVRLERAFQPGETRKPRGTDVEAGMGLPKLCDAATRLRALLIVKSGALLAVADFSRNRDAASPLFVPWPESVEIGDSGTTLTLLWPEIPGGGDQERLF